MERSIGQKPLLHAAPDEPVIDHECTRENVFFAIVVLVSRVAHGRIPIIQATDIPDVVQDVSMRLWKWSTKYGEKSEKMTEPDWNSFAARTAHNEINRYYSNRMRSKNEVPLDEAASIPSKAPEGEAEIEVASLVNKLWQEICSLTVYQRRSLLLHSPDLIVYFMSCGVTEEAIVRTLEFKDEEWKWIVERLPFTDAEIAEISQGDSSSGRRQPNPGAVKKARFDARKKLKGLGK